MFNGKEIEIIKGEKKGKKGVYLGTDGYTGRGVVCKLLIEGKPISFIWDYFKFTDLKIQNAWDKDDELKELDFDN